MATLALSVSLAIPTTTTTGAVAAPSTATPIQHLVVIFQENISFDHYFGTYPYAANSDGQHFTPVANTPLVDGLQPNSLNGNTNLLANNPNGANPRRFDPSVVTDVLTCDQNHGYTAEQAAFDHGKMDKFPGSVGTATGMGPAGNNCAGDDDLNYYDGNTVTGYWNYAQHFAMSDNSFDTVFGPSTPGAINVISGDTGGVGKVTGASDSFVIPDGKGGTTDMGDADPYYDDCSSHVKNFSMTGVNIGDELNEAGLSWGWFEGGFLPTTPYSGPATPGYVGGPKAQTGAAVCGTSHPIGVALGGTGQYGKQADYIPHHEPFDYYANTANPHHLAPTSLSVVGTDTQSFTGGSYGSGTPEFNTANHQYGIGLWNTLVADIAQGTEPPSLLPAVSYLKAPAYEDEHASYSDPLDGQRFVTSEINALEQTPDWSSTAVIVAFDDSDGWYDHVYSGVKNPSTTKVDKLDGAGMCGSGAPVAGEEGRCGYGPRLPLLVISPYAKANFVDHTRTDQSSVVKFIQDNWHLPAISGSAANYAGSLDNMFDFSQKANPTLLLNPVTGQPTPGQAAALSPASSSSHTTRNILAIVAGVLLVLVLLGGGFVFTRRRRA